MLDGLVRSLLGGWVLVADGQVRAGAIYRHRGGCHSAEPSIMQL